MNGFLLGAALEDESQNDWLKIGVYLFVERAKKDCVGSTRGRYLKSMAN